VRFVALAAILLALAIIWPGGIGSAAAVVGFFLAWYGGAAFDANLIRYAPGPGWWRPVVASVLGVVGVLALFEALSKFQDAIAPESPLLAAVNGMVIGAVVVMLLPTIFQLFLLARQEPR